MHWYQFLGSAIIIVFAGVRLTAYADKLSEELQFGKVWVGVILLGLVTSLPEAITSLAAVISLGANDLALGNVLGSNNFNPLLIFVMDIVYRRGSVTNVIEPNKSQNLSALFAVILTLIVVLEILSGVNTCIPPVKFLAIGSMMIALVYIGGMRYLARLGMSIVPPSSALPVRGNGSSLWNIWINILVSTGVVVLGAITLAQSADTIAEQTGLGRTFVGSILLAFTTSLPEMVVTISAMKLGSFDLAIGNIFGSNMTNMFIVFLCDVFYRGGSIFLTVSRTHIITGLLSILLTGIVLMGVYHKNKKTVLGLGWDSFMLLVLFISVNGVLYFG